MQLPKLLYPERVAAATIRGYLTQAHYSVLRWLDLKHDQAMLCEGDEDIDHYLLDAAGNVVAIEQQQVKDLTGRISARDPVAYDTIFNFLSSFHTHHAAGMHCTFVFTTTATLKEQQTGAPGGGQVGGARLLIDVLREWAKLDATSTQDKVDDLRAAIGELAREYGPLPSSSVKDAEAIERALAYLDADPTRWKDFLLAVSWETGQAGLSAVGSEIERRLKLDARTKHLPHDVLLPRLIAAVLGVSARSDAADRVLLPADVDLVAKMTEQQLQQWCAAHPRLAGAAVIELSARIDDIEGRVGQLERAGDPLEKLKRISRRALLELKTHATLAFRDRHVAIVRADADEIVAMAGGGNVVVVGEAGAGKSAVLHGVASRLETLGHDVVVVGADELPELEIGVALSDALDSWSGSLPGYLVVDALDSPRDEVAARRTQQALGQVVGLKSRWRVIASSRTFDLRARSPMADLFAGSPHSTRFDPGLALVRHFKVDALTDAELDQLQTSAPDLASVVAVAPPALKGLLRVPFNLSLAAKLIEAGSAASDVQTIRTQLELLDFYWARRVGEPVSRRYTREGMVRGLTAEMIRVRRLRVGVAVVTDPDVLPDLLSAHVLVHPQWTDAGAPDEGLLAFSHRVLFDYSVAALYLPSEPSDFARLVADQPDLVLLTRAGLEMYFQRAWAKDSSRSFFWGTAMDLMRMPEVREISKVVALAVAVRAAGTVADLQPLLVALSSSTESERGPAEGVLRHTVGSLLAAPRRERALVGAAAGPWAELASQLAAIGTPAGFDAAWRLLSVIVEGAADLSPPQLAAAGAAARAVFGWCYSNPVSTWLLGLSAELVCRTFRSDPSASATLIREVIKPDALQRHGHAVLLRIANGMPTLLASDAELVGEIFSAAFRHMDESRERTDMGGLVLPLASNRRQDYEGGLYALHREFPEFLKTNVVRATRTLVDLIEAYVDREHEQKDAEVRTFQFRGVAARVLTDYSAIWDSHPQANELVMLGAWEEYLVTAFEGAARAGLDDTVMEVVRSRGYAVLWRRLLAVAARAPSTAGAALRELLLSVPILTGMDTSEPAGNYLAAAFASFDAQDRKGIEDVIVAIPAKSSFPDHVEAAADARDRLLGSIGDASLLVTEAARDRLLALQRENAVPPNGPPVRFRRMSGRTPPPHEWLECKGVRIEEPANQRVAGLLEQLKALDAVATNVEPPRETLRSAAETVAAVQEALGAVGVHAALRDDAFDRLAGACERIAVWGAPNTEAAEITRRVLLDASVGASPQPGSSSASFDDHPSWGHPAARICAAVGLCSLASRCELADAELLEAIERLSADPEAPVRYQVARRVAFLHGDSERMWRIIEKTCASEQSRGVLQAIIASLRDARLDVARTARNVAVVLGRVRSGAGAKRVRELALSLAAALYVDLDEPQAREAITSAIADPGSEDAAGLPYCLRSRLGRVTANENGSGDAIRTRAWGVVTGLADTAIPMFLDLERRLRSGETLSEQDRAYAQGLAKVLDTLGREIYFASGAHDAKAADRAQKQETPDAGVYYAECRALVDRLADVGMPALAHHLLQLLEYLAPVDPKGVFLNVARAVKGAEKSGYQHDGLAVKLLVGIVTRYLLEHRALLREDEECRKALLDVLDTFVRAGWPEARTLTYDLHVIFQ